MDRAGLFIILYFGIGAGLVFGLFPEIDLRIAYAVTNLSPNGLALSITSVLRKFGPWIEILLIAPAVIAVIIKLFMPRTKMLISGRAVVFLIASLILGPGLLVNVALKDHWGRPRPGHTTQFGGHQQFVAWWDPRGECQKNCSFVSGEASSAFWAMAPAALAPPQWRTLAYAAALAFGIATSLSRMIMGGHFTSDTIFAGVFTLLVVWLMYSLIYRWQYTRLDDKAIEAVLERFSRHCCFVIGRLGSRSTD